MIWETDPSQPPCRHLHLWTAHLVPLGLEKLIGQGGVPCLIQRLKLIAPLLAKRSNIRSQDEFNLGVTLSCCLRHKGRSLLLGTCDQRASFFMQENMPRSGSWVA